MRYTKYFSSVIKGQGIPQFTQKQLQKFMNIVHLESKIDGIKFHAAKTPQNKDLKFNIHTFALDQKLTEITKNLEPHECLERLLDDNLY